MVLKKRRKDKTHGCVRVEKRNIQQRLDRTKAGNSGSSGFTADSLKSLVLILRLLKVSNDQENIHRLGFGSSPFVSTAAKMGL